MGVFILGFISGALAVLVAIAALSRSARETPKKARRWTSVSNIRFQWNFDYQWTKPLVARELIASLPEMMLRQLAAKPLPDDAPTIDPGAYSVELSVHARFVGREDEKPS